ncbi:hypothetical protein HT031_001732 [Scenedesmus sp. PABB004]|nr:hypothetical protein HT031_001732 [Scenedesmus sp. PABB004]
MAPTLRRYFTPYEVAAHSTPTDCWLSFLGAVYDVTTLIRDHPGPLIEPMLAAAGTDVSHWFDPATGDVCSRVDPDTQLVVPYCPQGTFLHVPPIAPTTTYDCSAAVPWWRDVTLQVGLLSARTRLVRVVNVLTEQEDTLEVPDEETLRQRYLALNAHAGSYTWKAHARRPGPAPPRRRRAAAQRQPPRRGRAGPAPAPGPRVTARPVVRARRRPAGGSSSAGAELVELDLNRTLCDNGLPDEAAACAELDLPPDAAVPALLLYWHDDLTVAACDRPRGRAATMSLALRLKVAAAAGGAAALAAVGYYSSLDVQRRFELASATGPLVRLLDPETSHKLGIWAARLGAFPRETRPDPESLRVTLWGRTFPNPIGLAAGFDKDAEAIKGLLGLGLGFMEVGSITPQPQPGNDKPRCFRLSELKAVINRYGFNSAGADAAAQHLDAFWKKVARDPAAKPGLLGVNLGKNKASADAADDYAIGLMKLGKYADFVVINVSSPNTPGLRSLQGRQALQDLVHFVKAARDKLDWGPGGAPPLLVKIAPDLTDADKADIAAVVLSSGVDGLVVGNTTLSRPGAVAEHRHGAEAGGLSGPPLFPLSTSVLADMYRLTRGTVPIIGCGGVASGEDAYAKIRAGASLVELYTALAYDGPAVVPAIKAQLAECLARDGFGSVADAVGADHRRGAARRGRAA